jgi:hypothetical protein
VLSAEPAICLRAWYILSGGCQSLSGIAKISFLWVRLWVEIFDRSCKDGKIGIEATVPVLCLFASDRSWLKPVETGWLAEKQKPVAPVRSRTTPAGSPKNSWPSNRRATGLPRDRAWPRDDLIVEVMPLIVAVMLMRSGKGVPRVGIRANLPADFTIGEGATTPPMPIDTASAERISMTS